MFLELNDVKKLIAESKVLHIAADENLLLQLPKGNWIGGTTPYFITTDGGIMSKDKLYVNELTNIDDFKIELYDEDIVKKIEDDSYDNGYSLLIVPYASKTAIRYAEDSPYSSELLLKTVVGWVAGFDLSENTTAKVFNGLTGESYSDKGIAIHAKLATDKLANINIINIFEQNIDTDIIEFESDSLEITDCIVNGNKMNFMDYLEKNNIDTQLPLVSNNNGIFINVSIKSIDKDTKTVNLYAPVLKDSQYHFSHKIDNYEEAFSNKVKDFSNVKPIFSCNCILNYIYGNLDGKKIPPFEGPITFGEIAYQLLNQTLVYLEY